MIAGSDDDSDSESESDHEPDQVNQYENEPGNAQTNPTMATSSNVRTAEDESREIEAQPQQQIHQQSNDTTNDDEDDDDEDEDDDEDGDDSRGSSFSRLHSLPSIAPLPTSIGRPSRGGLATNLFNKKPISTSSQPPVNHPTVPSSSSTLNRSKANLKIGMRLDEEDELSDEGEGAGAGAADPSSDSFDDDGGNPQPMTVPDAIWSRPSTGLNRSNRPLMPINSKKPTGVTSSSGSGSGLSSSTIAASSNWDDEVDSMDFSVNEHDFGFEQD